MNTETRGSAAARARHIHDLERIADDRREHLRVEMVTLAAEVRESTFMRAVAGGIARGRDLAQNFSSPLGGLGTIAQIFSRFGGGSSGRPKFPWKSMLSAGIGLFGIYRWWKARRH